MRFTLYIDTDRAPDGPTTRPHLIDLARNTLVHLEELTEGEKTVRPMRLMKIMDYRGYFPIGGLKVTDK